MAEDSAVKEPVKEEATAPASAEKAPTSADSDAAKPVAKPKKRKVKRSVPRQHVHVAASFNNTIVTITDPAGNVLTSASAGGCGFNGSKKGTAYAAQVASEKAINIAKQQFGLTSAEVSIKGIGLGRESAVRALSAASVNVDSIRDVTSIPHGGVRPRKARRV